MFSSKYNQKAGKQMMFKLQCEECLSVDLDSCRNVCLETEKICKVVL